MKSSSITYKKRWSELSFNELIRYHSIARASDHGQGTSEEVMALVEKLQEFEVVSGLVVKGRGVDVDGWSGKDDWEGVGEKVEWIERELARGGTCVWLRRRDGVNGVDGESGRNGRDGNDERNGRNGNDGMDGDEVLVMRKDEFVRLVHEATAWLGKKEGLLKLPEKFVLIEGETFALPTLVGNDDRVVRYGQYGDMQMYMMGIMSVMAKMESLQNGKGIADAQQAGHEELLEQLRMYRNGFLSSLLLPTFVAELKEEDATKRDGYRIVEQRRVRIYNRTMRERIAQKMDKAPSWLFAMLWHLVQSCLAYYHGRFPDLVSKGGSSKKNTDMYVAKLGTDNAVMKYAGYPSVSAVNNEPLGVILERLDAMAKESKEWEKARRKK